MMKVYVASSWRNEKQAGVVEALRHAEHEVYDFKNPAANDNGFHWTEIDPNWKNWTPKEFVEHLYTSRVAEKGFNNDMRALDWADACVLVMPCGRSAHLELGYAIGKRKMTVILVSDGEPELMYKMADLLTVNMSEVLD
ncbi:MAG: hypothetical protein IH991_12795, partial [Planctomycetes bacterium]|nr:hypothetical protein [Planctomycetota bacterium]